MTKEAVETLKQMIQFGGVVCPWTGGIIPVSLTGERINSILRRLQKAGWTQTETSHGFVRCH